MPQQQWIESEWEEFRTKVITNDSPVCMVEFAQSSFYAGQASMHRAFVHMLQRHEPQDIADFIARTTRELATYAAGLPDEDEEISH